MSYRNAASSLVCALLLIGGFCVAPARGDLVWDPGASTYNGKSFVKLQTGVGSTSLGLPGARNPVGSVIGVAGVQIFAFVTALPEGDQVALKQTDLSSSPLVAGTELLLYFNKEESDHISFVALIADEVGVRTVSPTRIEVRATVADPVLSESNNPDAVSATFGMVIFTTNEADSPLNFRGTVFTSDMHWLDLAPPGLDELPQTASAAEVAGFVAGLVAKGVSEEGGRARFDAYIPERLFAFARATGFDVSGDNCMGYRTYVELAGSDEGFFKLNVPADAPVADAAFDVDGDGSADPLWHYRIVNSTWSRQVLTFGRIETQGKSTAVSSDVWGQVKQSIGGRSDR